MQNKESLLSPVTKSRLHEDIIRQIQEKIISGVLPQGYKLPSERQLSLDFNVNRATVREALKKLEILGLIRIHHGDGIYVNDYLKTGNLELLKSIINMNGMITHEMMSNFLFIRRILVPEMAYLAAMNRSESNIQELRSTIFNTELSIHEKDLLVHGIIAQATQNLAYVFILNFFNDLYREYGDIYFNIEKNRNRSQKFHTDILKAIEIKDNKGAKKIMSEVLKYTENVINEYYQKREIS